MTEKRSSNAESERVVLIAISLEQELDAPLLPEMVFGRNRLDFHHIPSGFVLRFDVRVYSDMVDNGEFRAIVFIALIRGALC